MAFVLVHVALVSQLCRPTGLVFDLAYQPTHQHNRAIFITTDNFLILADVMWESIAGNYLHYNYREFPVAFSHLAI